MKNAYPIAAAVIFVLAAPQPVGCVERNGPGVGVQASAPGLGVQAPGAGRELVSASLLSTPGSLCDNGAGLRFRCSFDGTTIGEILEGEGSPDPASGKRPAIPPSAYAEGELTPVAGAEPSAEESADHGAVHIRGPGTEPELLRYDHVGIVDMNCGTIEFWIKLDWDCTEDASRKHRVWFDAVAVEVEDSEVTRTPYRIYLHSRNYELTFAVCDGEGSKHEVVSRSFPEWEKGTWHHVACTWKLSEGSMAIWTRAKGETEAELDSGTPSNGPGEAWPQLAEGSSPTVRLRIGRFVEIKGPLEASVDELRVYGEVCYEFPPPSPEEIAQLEAARARAVQNLEQLNGDIAAARAAGKDVSYFQAIASAATTGICRWGVVEGESDLCPEDTPAAPDPPSRQQYETFSQYCDYIEQQCAWASGEIAAGELPPMVPRPDVTDAEPVADTFENPENQKLLLVGIRNFYQDAYPEMSTYFNLDAWSNPGPDVERSLLQKAEEFNICGQLHLFWRNDVSAARIDNPCLWNVHGYSGYNWAERLCVDSPCAQIEIAEAIAGLPVIGDHEEQGGHPLFLYAMLSAEDRYMCYCNHSLYRFQQWLEGEYEEGGISELNAKWGTSYRGFDEVVDPPHVGGAAKRRAAWYDWLRFNRDRVSEFYRWLKDGVRQAGLAQTPLNGGTHTHLADSRFGRRGVDTWALNNKTDTDKEAVNDVLQCETMYRPPTYGRPFRRPSGGPPPYGLDIHGEARLDWQRSTCGAPKPATDLEFHAWYKYLDYLDARGETLPANYTSAAIYRHFLHGARAANIWVWDWPAKPRRAFKTSPLIPLASVEECFRAALDVRRLVSQVLALSNATSKVAVFFSDSTFLQIHPSCIKAWHVPTPCTVELDNVLHGSMFLDTPIGFVTERTVGTLTAGDAYKLVLVPGVSHIPRDVFDELMKYVKKGNILVVTPRSFLLDEYNHPQSYLKDEKLISVIERETVVKGLLPEFDQEAFGVLTDEQRREQLEQAVVDPGDFRIPKPSIIKLTPEGKTFFGAENVPHLEGVGVRQSITIEAPKGKTTILATFDADTEAADEDAKPAIVKLSHGAGTIYYCATPLRPRGYAALLEAVFNEAGVDRPIRVKDDAGNNAWGVEVRACEYQGKMLVYAINLQREPVKIRLVSGTQPITTITNQDLITTKPLKPSSGEDSEPAPTLNPGDLFTLEGLQTVIVEVTVPPSR